MTEPQDPSQTPKRNVGGRPRKRTVVRDENVIEQMQRMGRKIWERLPSESTAAYDHFCKYRDMGAERSIPALAHERGSKNPSGYMVDLSRKHWWTMRAEAYDRYLDEVKNRKLDEAIERNAEVWAQREAHLRENEYVISHYMLQQVAELLEKRQVKLTDRELTRWVLTASKLARLSMGIEQQNTKVQNEVAGFAMVEEASTSELADLLRRAGEWEDEGPAARG